MDAVFHASDDVIRGTLLHDIGKSMVPFNLTIYPCSLNENERKIVDDHTLYGAELLAGYDDVILECVLYHHDALYQKKYIQQLRACDVFDALINDRAYRKACTLKKTKEEMLKMGINPSFTNDLVIWYNTNVSDIYKNQIQRRYLL